MTMNSTPETDCNRDELHNYIALKSKWYINECAMKPQWNSQGQHDEITNEVTMKPNEIT